MQSSLWTMGCDIQGYAWYGQDHRPIQTAAEAEAARHAGQGEGPSGRVIEPE